jgi:hypothetical protein
MKRIVGIAGLLCALLVAWWLYRPFGQRSEQATEWDTFLFGVALQFKAPELCEKIPLYAAGAGAGWGQPGYQISYLQSECYFNLASELHDLSLCDKVRPLSRRSLDGSKYNPDSCRAGQKSHAGGVDPHVVTTWMRQLGYTDPDIDHFDYRNGYNSLIHQAYDRLLKEDQFAKKMAAAPSFAEPRATAGTRTPNDLEYLYGMYAIDAKDASVCGKISPNARKQWFNQQTISLRVECYHDLAKNTRNPKLCVNVPVQGNQPPTPDFDSRGTCLRDVEIVQREPPSKAYWSPGFPPTFESFKKALKDLDVDPDLPRPTDSDYEDFLQYLTDRDPAGRAEFLRRVAALK